MNTTVCKPIYLINIFTVLYLILSFGVYAEAQDIQAELRPAAFAVDQTATLQIKIGGVQNAEIDMPEVDGLVFHQGGKSSNIQIINGAVSSSVTYSFGVQAQKEGAYTIPAITVVIEGKKHYTDPINVSVAKSTADTPSHPSQQGGQAPAQLDSLSFIKFIPQKEKSYLGEVVPVQIKAYFRQGTRINQISLPRFQGEGLLLDELSSNPPQTEETVGNVPYRVLIWDTYITGVKEGLHQIKLDLDATLLVPSRGRSPISGFGSNFFNDDLFNDFFSSYSSKPIKVTSPETPFKIMVLPETLKPEGFTGAVGNFTLKLEARPTEVELGEPITLAMSVAGTGNFNHVEAPLLSDHDKIKLYTPNSTFSPGNSPYQGSKRFEQAAVITDPEARQIPPVVFSFFNPDTAQYQTIFSDPVDITIKSTAIKPEAADLTSNTGNSDVKEAVPGEDQGRISLVPVKLETGTIVERIRPPFLAPWFIAAISACFVLITGLFGYRFYSRFQAGHPEIRKRKALNVQKKQTLARLEKLDPSNPGYPAQARDTVEKYLCQVQQKKSGSLTTGDIVGAYGNDSAVTELFRLDDQSRYGQFNYTPVDRQQLNKKLKDFIESLP